MWNQLVQGIAIGAALLFFYGGIDKKHKGHRIPYFLCAGVAFLLCGTFSFLRVENFFYSFPSARAAAEYAGSGALCGIVEGDGSAMAVYLAEGEVQTGIFPKSDKGYKLGTPLNAHIVANTTDAPTSTRIVRCGEDHYVLVVSAFDTDAVTAADNQGTVFSAYSLPTDDGTGLTYHLFFAPLAADPTPLGGGYQITVTPDNGDPILLSPLVAAAPASSPS